VPQLAELFAVAFVAFAVGTITDQWLLAASLPVLWAVWKFMRLEDGPPVLVFALTFHWGQVAIGLIYYALTGREPLGMTAPRYGTMVLIGLGCVLTFVAGIRLGDFFVRRKMKPQQPRETSVGWGTLLVCYIAILAFRSTLRDFAAAGAASSRKRRWRQPSRRVLSLLSPCRAAYGAGTSAMLSPARAADTIISDASSMPVERRPSRSATASSPCTTGGRADS